MQTIIFNHSNYPYYVHTKDLTKKLNNKHNNFQYQYINIHTKKITKKNLQQKTNKPIKTIPQIFINQQHINNYTNFTT